MSEHTTNHPHCHVLTVVDGVTEEVIDVIELPNLSLEAFRRHYEVPAHDDPEMVDRYSVGPDDLAFVRQAAGQEVHFDLTKYAYFIEAVLLDT